MNSNIDPTEVQARPTAPDTEQDVGMFVINTLNSLAIDQARGVALDHEKRIDFGEKKYGQRLRTRNGRNTGLDLYQEVLDGLSYSGQLWMEDKDDGRVFYALALIAADIKRRFIGGIS